LASPPRVRRLFRRADATLTVGWVNDPPYGCGGSRTTRG
jgi:hypothetical protein